MRVLINVLTSGWYHTEGDYPSQKPHACKWTLWKRNDPGFRLVVEVRHGLITMRVPCEIRTEYVESDPGIARFMSGVNGHEQKR